MRIHRPERLPWPHLAVVGLVLPLAGCGPSPEQLFIYQMVLVSLGLVVGLVIVALGRWIGRRLVRTWTLCVHCQTPQPVTVRRDKLQPCTSCGQGFPARPLPRRDVRKLLGRRPYRIGWWMTWLLALGLAAVTFCAMCLPGLILQEAYPEGIDVQTDQLLKFPLAFAFYWTRDACPGLATGLMFISWTTVALAMQGLEEVGLESRTAMAAIAYGAYALILAAHWFVGLRRYRLGWLLPVVLTLLNITSAVVGLVITKAGEPYDWPPIVKACPISENSATHRPANRLTCQCGGSRWPLSTWSFTDDPIRLRSLQPEASSRPRTRRQATQLPQVRYAGGDPHRLHARNVKPVPTLRPGGLGQPGRRCLEGPTRRHPS